MSIQPQKRSALRILAGKYFYISQRYYRWFKQRKIIAANIDQSVLPYLIYSHSTPYIRQLSGLNDELQYNKIINLKLASLKLNGILIFPGELFSFWKLVGKPTKRRGFLPGMTLYYGKIKPGVGGGLCQLTNLIYWITLHTPLVVTERYRHSFDIFPDSNRTQPFGSGATCVYNYRDLQIYNPTENIFQLVVNPEKNELNVKWFSSEASPFRYEIYESAHCIKKESWGGYTRNNVIKRKTFSNEEIINDEIIAENSAYMLYQPFLDLKDGSDKK